MSATSLLRREGSGRAAKAQQDRPAPTVKVHPLAKKANPRPPRRPCRELIPVFWSIATHAPSLTLMMPPCRGRFSDRQRALSIIKWRAGGSVKNEQEEE